MVGLGHALKSTFGHNVNANNTTQPSAPTRTDLTMLQSDGEDGVMLRSV